MNKTQELNKKIEQMQLTFLESYVSHMDDSNLEDWLFLEMKKHLKDLSDDEIRQMNTDLLDELDSIEEAKRLVKVAKEDGLSPTKWLALQIQKTIKNKTIDDKILYLTDLINSVNNVNNDLYNISVKQNKIKDAILFLENSDTTIDKNGFDYFKEFDICNEISELMVISTCFRSSLDADSILEFNDALAEDKDIYKKFVEEHASDFSLLRKELENKDPNSNQNVDELEKKLLTELNNVLDEDRSIQKTLEQLEIIISKNPNKILVDLAKTAKEEITSSLEKETKDFISDLTNPINDVFAEFLGDSDNKEVKELKDTIDGVLYDIVKDNALKGIGFVKGKIIEVLPKNDGSVIGDLSQQVKNILFTEESKEEFKVHNSLKDYIIRSDADILLPREIPTDIPSNIPSDLPIDFPKIPTLDDFPLSEADKELIQKHLKNIDKILKDEITVKEAVVELGKDLLKEKIIPLASQKLKDFIENNLNDGSTKGLKTATAGALKVSEKLGDLDVVYNKFPPILTGPIEGPMTPPIVPLPHTIPVAQIASISIDNISTLKKLGEGEITVGEAVQEVAETTVSNVGSTIGAAKGASVGASIGAFLGPIGSAIGGAIGGTIGAIAGSKAGQAIVKGTAMVKDVAVSAVKTTASLAVKATKAVGNFAVGTVKTVVGAAKSVASATWEGAKSFGSAVCSGIGAVFSGIGSFFGF